MRREAIIKYIGYVLLFNSLFLYVSAIISFYLNETSFVPLFYSGLVCTILGLFPLIFTERIDEVRFSEGLAISVTGWFITCIVGMLPYLMWGGEFTFANAFFESVSGYTTTGSTILNEIESLPKGILFYDPPPLDWWHMLYFSSFYHRQEDYARVFTKQLSNPLA